MKKYRRICWGLLSLFVFVYVFPLAVLAAGDVVREASAAVREAPVYERVAAKKGSWHTEQVAAGDKGIMAVGYKGRYGTVLEGGEFRHKIRDDVLLTGIYVPYREDAGEKVRLAIYDRQGSRLGEVEAYRTWNGDVSGMEKQDAGGDEDDFVYVAMPEDNLVLPKGEYVLRLEPAEGATGEFLVKGKSMAGIERERGDSSQLGHEGMAEGQKITPEMLAGAKKSAKPMVFALDKDYRLDEVLINTYNGGEGALPGMVEIYNQAGQLIWQGKASGLSLGATANGMWAVYPGIVLKAGNYRITVSLPEAVSYDEKGEPMFYVSVSEAKPSPFDFTGTYLVDAEGRKTSTLMGPVNGSSYVLNGFELAVLEKEGFVELIGRYKGMPFSQNCEVVEKTEKMVKARFSFSASLSAEERISAEGTVILSRKGGEKAFINISGNAYYTREGSSKRGADANTYVFKAQGNMVRKDLPPFVATVLGSTGSVGNIPGPDSAAQAAAGILFPPLVGLVVNVLQEARKAREEREREAKKKRVRDKSWYKAKYPNASDETLAMIMLADAMANTDEPDEEDAFSAGDDEKGQISGDSTYDEGYEEEEAEEIAQEEPEGAETPDSCDYGRENSKHDVVQEERTEKNIPGETPLETMEITDPLTGNTLTYVKDPASGEWYDPQTGFVFSEDRLRDAQRGKEFQEFYNKQDRMKNQEPDPYMKEAMEEINNRFKQEEFKEAMRRKYGTRDDSEIMRIIRERQEKEREAFDRWQRIGDIAQVMETGGKVVQVGADVAIDGLAAVTPGGSKVRAVYKLVKGIAGSAADKGLNAGSLVEGAIKGTADAGLDYIEGPVKGVNPALIKAGISVAGETAGSTAGAALRGENWKAAGMQGLVDGTLKAGVGTITDKLTSSAPPVKLPEGPVNILSTSKHVLVNKGSLTRIASGLTDEFVVKPVVGDPIKKALE